MTEFALKIQTDPRTLRVGDLIRMFILCEGAAPADCYGVVLEVDSIDVKIHWEDGAKTFWPKDKPFYGWVCK